jgi:hypothetical protein
MLGTRDWEGKGILGDEVEDLRLDLSGFRRGTVGDEEVLETEGECNGEVRGKGTGLVFNLSRNGGRWRSSSS